MIYWAQLFHFYQPSVQLPMVVAKVCSESYKPLIDVLQKYPQARATANINGVTLEMLHDYGHDDVVAGLRELGRRGGPRASRMSVARPRPVDASPMARPLRHRPGTAVLSLTLFFVGLFGAFGWSTIVASPRPG